MMFINIICFIILPLTLAQNQKKIFIPKCNANLTIDITNGTRNSATNDIFYDNITYTESDYFLNDTNVFQILGCLCNIQRCVRKCCAIGSTFSTENYTCVKSDHDLTDDFQIPVYNKTNKIIIQDPNNYFKFIVGKYCTYGAFLLDPDSYNEEKFYLQYNGSLYFPNGVSKYYDNQEDYCIDFSDNSNLTIVLECLPTPVSNPAGTANAIGIFYASLAFNLFYANYNKK